MTLERGAKSQATQERILSTALALFAEKGFAQTTMREIALKAGCSLGLAYRYFTSKEAMVLTLYERLVAEFAAEVRDLPSGALAERWARATRGDIARLEPHRAALTGLAAAGIAPGGATQVLGAATAAIRREMLTLFGTLVRGAKDAPKPALAEAFVTLLYTLHLLLVFFWLQDSTPGQRITHQLIDFGEDIFGRLRPAFRLTVVAAPLIRLAAILTPLLDGSGLGSDLSTTPSVDIRLDRQIA